MFGCWSWEGSQVADGAMILCITAYCDAALQHRLAVLLMHADGDGVHVHFALMANLRRALECQILPYPIKRQAVKGGRRDGCQRLGMAALASWHARKAPAAH